MNAQVESAYGGLRTAFDLFLGKAANGYKLAILAFLLLNPLLLALFGPFVAGWAVLFEFIFTLALALKCYPLQPGGLLAIEAIAIGLASPATVYHETEANFAVILLLIFMVAGWDFARFFVNVAPVSMPVLAVGLTTCVVLEKLGWFGYGEQLLEPVREIMERYDLLQDQRRDADTRLRLGVQGATAVFLVLGLALPIAEVGLIGLSVIVLATAFCGVIEELRLGQAFEEALPFTALLVTFFAIVAVIHEQHLFKPALDAGAITRAQFDLLAVAVNTGTNIPSVATPNGQAAFLFLLTSALAPLIRLGYMRMLWMALPYTLAMSLTGLLATLYLL